MKTDQKIEGKSPVPLPLPQYATLPAYEPFPGRDAFLCMDANEGPVLPEDFLKRVLAESGRTIIRYPEYQDLRRAAADTYELPEEAVMPLNGADEGIRLVMQAYCQSNSRVLGVEPGFSMYPIYARMAGASFSGVPSLLTFGLDLAGLCQAVPEADLLVLASPNNPSGQRILPLEIIRILETCQGRPFLLDETYAAFCGQNFIPWLRRFPNLLILRTLSKSYGVPGLRLGFLLADPDLLRRLEPLRSPYNVSAVAASVGAVLLREDREYSRRCRKAVKAAERLRRRLLEAGIQAYHSDTHFFLAQLRPGLEQEAAARLKDHGILVRVLGEKPTGLLRISVAAEEQVDRFLAAFLPWWEQKIKNKT